MTDSQPLLTVVMPYPAKLLSMNDRMHWRPKAALVDRWREATYWSAVAAWGHAHIAGTAPERPFPPCVVRVALAFRDNRRRDPHNYFATVKPIIDGLVDAKLWLDDTSEHVTVVEPTLATIGREQLPAATITIEAR